VVQLPECEDGEMVAVYTVGPVALTGNALDTARATLNSEKGEWVVSPVFKGGDDGIGLFNAVAAQCFTGATACPVVNPVSGHGQLAIVLDSRVISAPTIQTDSFKADQISISGTFGEREARDLATSLKYGALPVELEQQQAQIVSATLGRDALHAGLIAGLVGLVLVTIYMVAFYRLLGALSIVKLAIEGALLWSIISYLGTSNGLALTLAGITGIIVSIGVAVDSNVVFYEDFREKVWRGSSPRSVATTSFNASFRTIVTANMASLIGAVLLYVLTVGSVRGFALFLAIGTVLDMIASYWFMRPMALYLARSRRWADRPRWLGMAARRGEQS